MYPRQGYVPLSVVRIFMFRVVLLQRRLRRSAPGEYSVGVEREAKVKAKIVSKSSQGARQLNRQYKIVTGLFQEKGACAFARRLTK